MTVLARYTRQIVEEQGWQLGSSLENLVAFRLCRWRLGPNVTQQQHRVGPYRLDFAWPTILVALEADGWHHARPASAARDVERDRYLRHQGWLVFRIDDEEGEDGIIDQLLRVVVIVRGMLAQDINAGLAD